MQGAGSPPHSWSASMMTPDTGLHVLGDVQKRSRRSQSSCLADALPTPREMRSSSRHWVFDSRRAAYFTLNVRHFVAAAAALVVLAIVACRR
jgi:hypothetical protein